MTPDVQHVFYESEPPNDFAVDLALLTVSGAGTYCEGCRKWTTLRYIRIPATGKTYEVCSAVFRLLMTEAQLRELPI